MENEEIVNEDYEVSALSDLPVSIDLSNNLAFPSIGNQGNISSCTAWATTYYQFTYELNRFKDTNARTSNGVNIESNICSPSWTYNYINAGKNIATYNSDAYNVLRNQGAISLADMPYDETLSSYSFDWSSNIEKMTDALRYRAVNHSFNVSNASYVNEAKSKLAEDHVLTVWSNAYGWTIASNNNGEKFIVRGSNGTDQGGNIGGHFLTVVGYNDNIQITVNGVTLTGAFKIANSWGNNWGNGGFIWVSYDALNSSSEYGTSWQTGYNTSRTPVFGYNNTFTYIDINECNVTFAGYIFYGSKAPYDIELYAANGTTAGNNLKWSCIPEGDVLTGLSRKYLVFDYFTLDNSGYSGNSYNLDNCLSSLWTVRLYNTADTASTTMRTVVIDNFGNKIAPVLDSWSSLNGNNEVSSTINVNIAKGRVTAYDNASITSADSQKVLDFLVGNISLSRVQIYLADYNCDGSVTTFDVVAMNRAIAAQNGETYAITDYIDEWGCSLADVIEEEYNIPIEQYVAENYEELYEMDVVPTELELY